MYLKNRTVNGSYQFHYKFDYIMVREWGKKENKEKHYQRNKITFLGLKDTNLQKGFKSTQQINEKSPTLSIGYHLEIWEHQK